MYGTTLWQKIPMYCFWVTSRVIVNDFRIVSDVNFKGEGGGEGAGPLYDIVSGKKMTLKQYLELILVDMQQVAFLPIFTEKNKFQAIPPS